MTNTTCKRYGEVVFCHFPDDTACIQHPVDATPDQLGPAWQHAHEAGFVYGDTVHVPEGDGFDVTWLSR